MVMTVLVTNLTTDAVAATSTAPAPVESLAAAPHQPAVMLSPLTIVIVVVVICLTLLGIIIAIRRKRRLDRLRHSLIPFYSFDANEEEDWDSDLLQHENGTPTIRSYGSVELNVMITDIKTRSCP